MRSTPHIVILYGVEHILYASHFPKIVELGEKALPNKKEYLNLPNIKIVK